MGRLAARGALLRLAYLREERGNRRHPAEALEPLAQPREPVRARLGVRGQIAERDDQLDARTVVGVPQREVPDPGAVGRDPVADALRQHESADRRRCEDRLRHLLGGRRPGRVEELVRALRVDGDVGRRDEDLDRRGGEVARELDGVADPIAHGLREPVVVRAEERLPPEPVRPERVVGLEPEHEVLQLVEPVERGHRPRERPGGRAVDPADARPELAVA